MRRINEAEAAEAFVAKLEAGVYSLERSKNDAENYSESKEARDTQAVRAFMKSSLFQAFKDLK